MIVNKNACGGVKINGSRIEYKKRDVKNEKNQ